MIIPYDVKKISEVTRFKFDTVVVAMELYKKIGLILEQEDGVFTIANFENVVGSESKWAEKKRLQRDKKADKVLNSSEDIRGNLSDKRIEYRDKSIDKDINNTTTTTTGVRVEILQPDEETPVFKKYCDNIHPITGSVEVDALIDLIEIHSAVWVSKAIDEAIGANVRNLKYISAILERWQTTGLGEPWMEKREKRGQRSAANNKPPVRKGKKQETDWSKETGGW